MAGRIPPSFIDGLLARADIVEVIGRYVPLQKRGREHVACCPFHEEKTPSFKVNAEKQFYHCFGCGAGGSVIQFLMEHQRMQFVEAVETLAEHYGLAVPREGGGSPREAARFNAIYDALDKAARFYRAQLTEHIEAANYFKSRGLAPETFDVFHLGYAPPAYGHLKKCFGSGYDEALLIEAGLLARGEDRGRGAYERLRDRAIFPIRAARGRVVGFGGRLLPGRENPAKYLNSPETRVFKKRETLYGLYELRQARDFDRVVVVEGYMDVVSLAQHGVRNAVATLGTATTRPQIRALFKITPRIVFCFDADRAGNQAAARAAEQALPEFADGREIAFMFLPEGQDPDGYVRARGGDEFIEASRNAMPLAKFLFRHHGQGLDLSDPAACAKLADRLQPLLAQLPPQSVFRELMFSKLAEKTGVAVQSLQRRGAIVAAKPSPAKRAPAQGTLYSTIRVAVRALFEQPRLAARDAWMQAAFDTDDLRRLEKRGARFLADLIDKIRTHEPTTTAGVLELYRDGGEEDSLKRLMASSPPAGVELDRRAEFADAVARLKKDLEEQDVEKKIARLTAKSEKDGLSKVEREEITRLLGERHKLRSPPPVQN